MIIMAGLDIQERKISILRKKIKKKSGRVKIFKQYVLTLPKKHVEGNKINKLYLVANKIWFGAPNEETLIKVIKHLPEIEEMIK
jgi:Tfp pilus assembly PilM family ATPase